MTARRGRSLCVLQTTPLDVRKDSATDEGPAQGLVFASRLEVFFCLSFGRNLRPSYASSSAVTRSGSHLSLRRKPHCFEIFLLTWDLEDHRNMPGRNHQRTISRMVCLTSQKACVTSTKISPKTLSQSLFCALCVPPFLFPMFSPFSTPHLEWSPDVEQGEGEIACLAIRSEKGLRGALRENVGTTLKFVWMPLSTIWCNVQFGTWHFKWKLCFPDERDLGPVELEGGVVLEALFNSLDKQPAVSVLSRRPSTLWALFQ